MELRDLAMLYMFIVLAFIIGFFIGALCYSLGFLKIFHYHKVMDELTRTKRELASAKRVLDEFFKTSGQLFGDLDKSYREYAKFMNEAASKLSTQDGSLFIPQDELEVEESLKKMLGGKHLEDFNAERENASAPENKKAVSEDGGETSPMSSVSTDADHEKKNSADEKKQPSDEIHEDAKKDDEKEKI